MSGHWNKHDEEEDEVETEEDDNAYKAGEDRIIFLIDARPAMFEKNRSGEVHIVNCLRVTLEVMKAKIIASEKSAIGVIFFGAKVTSDKSPDGVHVLFPLDSPTAKVIRQLQGMLDDLTSDEPTLFENTVGSSDNSYCPLKEAFSTCNGAFGLASSKHRQYDFRRIWLFTNDDDPIKNHPGELQGVLQYCKDCWDVGIDTSLWHMNRLGVPPFQPAKFYLKLLRVGGEDGDDAQDEDYVESRMKGAGYDSFDTMMANVRRKEHRKRRLGNVIFTVGVDARIAVQLYKMVSISRKPAHTWLLAQTNDPVRVKTEYINQVSGTTARDVKTVVEMHDIVLSFEKDELDAIKRAQIVTAPAASSSSSSSSNGSDGGGDADTSSTAAGIKLMFFAPAAAIPPEHSTTTPYFVFPDERRLKGSANLCIALVGEMAAKGVVAVVRFARTESAHPRLAAMYPQKEVMDGDGNQVLPCGFNLVMLPFNGEDSLSAAVAVAETIGSSSSSSSSSSNGGVTGEGAAAGGDDYPEVAAAAARKVIRALHLDAVPYEQAPSSAHLCYFRDLKNPAMQSFYSVLQSTALMEPRDDTATELVDLALKPRLAIDPDEEGGGAGAAAAVGEWTAVKRKTALMQLKDKVGVTEDMVELAKKRPASGGAGGTAAKKPKPGPTASADELTEWRELLSDGLLEKQSAPALKEICKKLAVMVSGAKAVLVARIAETLAGMP